ncbi:MAG: VWA domain-containing protein [Myxococcales bacterium]|nr:VWA domain-containing protein [Myxococcales bacterium]
MIRLALPLIVLATGCPPGQTAGSSSTAPIEPTEVTETQTETVTDTFEVLPHAVDILFVVDNSASMGPAQEALLDSLPRFVEELIAAELDFHLGVVTTDMEDPDQQGKLRRTDDGTFFVDLDTPEAVEVVQKLASVGTQGSGTERGIGAIYTALALLSSTFNEGFRRDDAWIHTLVFSDEPDATQRTLIEPAEFVQWYGGLHQEQGGAVVSAFEGWKEPTQYTQLAEQTGGVQADLLQPTPGLRDVGGALLPPTPVFELSEQPEPSSLAVSIVTVDDAQTTAVRPSGFVHDEAANTVTLLVELPPGGVLVQVTYQPLADVR